MIVGNAPRLQRDHRLNDLSLQVLASIRQEVSPTTWQFTFMSPFWRLYWHHSPGAFLMVDDVRYDILPNRVVLVPAHIRFTCGTAASLRQDYLHFELFGLPPTTHRRMFPGIATLPDHECLRTLGHAWSKSIRNRCDDPSTEQMAETPRLEAEDFSEYLLAASLANAALAMLVADFDERQRETSRMHLGSSERIRRAIEVIESDLSASSDNQTLAELCHLSRAHFIRVFSSATGMTPVQYRIHRRLEKSCVLLARSGASIERIAADLGFTDRAHFTKAFEQRYRVTPVAYRRQFIDA